MEGGSADLYYGCMFSGKSTMARAIATRHIAAHQKVVVFKPKRDSRGRNGILSSHDGMEYPPANAPEHPNLVVHVVEDFSRVLELSIGAHVVIFEEAQMWSNELGIVRVMPKLREYGRIVYVFMLDLTFNGMHWPAFAPNFMACDRQHQLTAICPGLNGEPCGKDAMYSKRLSESKALIEIGGSDKYQAACYKHFHMIYDPTIAQFNPHTLQNSG